MRSTSWLSKYGARLFILFALIASAAYLYTTGSKVSSLEQPVPKKEINKALSPYEMHLKNRINEVRASEPVALIAVQAASVDKAKEGERLAAVDEINNAYEGNQIQKHDPEAPVNGTVHASPFTDDMALKSIAEKASLFAASGRTPVVKVGQHADGSPMTLREKEEMVRSTLTQIPDEWTVTYKADNERLRIYTFTDPTCPFCQKKHEALQELLDNGVSVHYLLYPRDMTSANRSSLSRNGQNMMNAWCAPDQKAAFDDLFHGYRIPNYNCADQPERLPPPIIDHLLIGDLFGVTGTPSIFASNGRSVEGFSDAQRLMQILQD